MHSPSPEDQDTLIEQSVKYSNRTVIRSVYFLVETPLKNPRHAPDSSHATIENSRLQILQQEAIILH